MDSAAIWQLKKLCGESLDSEFDLNSAIDLIGVDSADIVSCCQLFSSNGATHAERVPSRRGPSQVWSLSSAQS